MGIWNLLFGNSKKNNSENIDDIIATNPKIAKIDKELGDLNRQAGEQIRKSPTLRKMFKNAGLDY